MKNKIIFPKFFTPFLVEEVGLHLGDGCIYLEKKNSKLYPRIEMATILESFSIELKEMLINFGFRLSYYKEKRQKKGWKDLFRIIIRRNEITNKWFYNVKPLI